jgi:hypothetical protein
MTNIITKMIAITIAGCIVTSAAQAQTEKASSTNQYDVPISWPKTLPGFPMVRYTHEIGYMALSNALTLSFYTDSVQLETKANNVFIYPDKNDTSKYCSFDQVSVRIINNTPTFKFGNKNEVGLSCYVAKNNSSETQLVINY